MTDLIIFSGEFRTDSLKLEQSERICVVSIVLSGRSQHDIDITICSKSHNLYKSTLL